MIDPFTLATGIVGILSLTIQVAQITSEFVTSVKDAPTAATELLQELNSLIAVLKRLDHFLQTERSKNPLPFLETSVICSTSNSCDKKMKTLRARLPRFTDGNKISGLLRRLKWPIDEKESQQIVEDVHQYTQTFAFALYAQWLVISSILI